MEKEIKEFSKIKLAYLVVILFISLILVNIVSSYLKVRFDFTKENLFTLSDGSKKIITTLSEPVTLKFYYATSVEEIPPQIKLYIKRVRELLQEYELNSDGKIKLETYNVEPDTENEEWANKYGMAKIPLPSGGSFYFGVVGVMLDQESAIPYFDIRRQEFLEYDISQVILSASREGSTKIGVLSSVPLFGNPLARQPSRGEPWVIISELKKNFEVEEVANTVTEIDKKINLLLVVHPQGFDDKIQYAIDQFVMRGGKLILVVDPRANTGQAGQNRGPQSNPASSLPKLFKTWGVDFKSNKVVGDLSFAANVNAGAAGTIRYPFWMVLNDSAIDRKHEITSKLEKLVMIDSGSFELVKDSKAQFLPLITTTKSTGVVESALTRFTPPDKLAKNFKMDHKPRVLAAILQDKFNSSFSGPLNPSDTNAHIAQAENTGSILLIGDVDFISDTYSVEVINLFGQSIVNPINDNLNFMVNSVEFLSGNDALMSIRARGRFSREFNVVKDLQQRAVLRYQNEEAGLKKKLDEVREKLKGIQSQPGSQNIVLTADQQKQIKDFREEERKTKNNLRLVRKNLRKDIELLGNFLFLLNILVVPSTVLFLGIFAYYKRIRGRG